MGRWRWIALAGVAVAIAALVAVLAARREALAEAALRAALARRGIAPASFAVTRVSPGGLRLRDLRLGPPEAPDLAAEAVAVAWSLAGLRAGVLDEVAVEGLRLRGQAGGEAGLALGVLDALRAPAGAEATEAPPALPLRRLALADAQLGFETPAGPVRVEVDGALAIDPEGAVLRSEEDLALALEHPELVATGTLALAGAPGDLGGTLALDLRDARTPARVAPLALEARFAHAPAAPVFDATVSGADGALALAIAGSAEPAAGRAQARWRLAPLELAPDGPTPATLVPALAEALPIADVAGRVEAHGTATLADGAPDLRIELALRDLALTHPLARVAGLTAALSLRGPPLHMPATQPVAIALVDPGLPLTDGLVELRLREDATVAVRGARWRWAGGELRLGALTLGADGARGEPVLDVEGLELGELFALVALEGLEGSGRLDGRVPLALGADAIAVADGRLAAVGGGTIRYRPDPKVRALAAARPGDLGLAVEAFSNFHYEALEAHLDGALDGAIVLALHVRGSNPDFQDGRPVELNLELDARLADLVRAGLASYRVPDVVEERLRAFTEDAPPDPAPTRETPTP